MMEAIVVSGAQGLLGNAILKALIIEFPEAEIIALARKPIDIQGIKTIIWNLPYSLPKSSEFPKKFHYIHMANLLKSKDPEQFKIINCEALSTFLGQFDDQILSITWSSSLSVLGQGPFQGAQEDQITSPKTDLALSRLNQEKLILDYGMKKNITCYGLRGRLYIGREEKEFNSYLRLILRKPFLAFNKGKTSISVITASDYALVVCALLRKELKTRAIFNVAYSKPLSIEMYLNYHNLKPRWTLNSKILSALSVILPGKISIGLKTKLELLGLDQVMDVSKLELYIGETILNKDPLDIVNEYISKQ